MIERDSRFWLWRTLLVAAVVLYAGLLGWRVGAVAGGSDSSGYLNHARMIAAGTIRVPTRALESVPAPVVSAYAYVPLGFAPAAAGDPREMVAIYPLGLPLLIAAAAQVVGWEAAAPVTMVAHALAGIGLLYALGRATGLQPRMALLGCVILGACPLYSFLSVQLMSDVPAMAWTTAALLCASRARECVGWSWATGVALAMAVLVRPTNALAAVPIGILFGAAWSRWWRAGLAGLPAAVGLALYNRAAYGHPLQFGYGPIAEAFSVDYAGVTAWHYVRWLPVLLVGVVALAPGALWRRELARVWRAALGAWIVVLFGFYAFYPFTHQDWWALRFVLPAFPALIVCSLHGMWSVAERSGVSLRVARVLCVPAIVGWGAGWSQPLRSWRIGDDERVYVRAAEWAKERLPANAVIFGGQTSGALYHYTGFTQVHWAFATDGDVKKIVDGAAREGRPVYAMLFPFEREMLARRWMPGEWELATEMRHIGVWRLIVPKQQSELDVASER